MLNDESILVCQDCKSYGTIYFFHWEYREKPIPNDPIRKAVRYCYTCPNCKGSDVQPRDSQ